MATPMKGMSARPFSKAELTAASKLPRAKLSTDYIPPSMRKKTSKYPSAVTKDKQIKTPVIKKMSKQKKGKLTKAATKIFGK